MAEKKKATLVINSYTYTVMHDEPDDYMQRIAHYLNNKIEAASQGGVQLNGQTALVMAGVSITDELFKSQKNFNGLNNEIKRTMDEFDSLKSENKKLQETIDALTNQVEELKKKLLIAQVSNEHKKSY